MHHVLVLEKIFFVLHFAKYKNGVSNIAIIISITDATVAISNIVFISNIPKKANIENM